MSPPGRSARSRRSSSFAASCSHVGAIVLPGPVSVAGVRSVFDENDNAVDQAIEKRIRGVAVSLVDYIKRNICPRIALENMVREGDGT